MGDEEGLKERQEEEVEALKAIYDRDFRDLRDKDVWKVKRSPEFQIHLRPQHDSRGQLEDHVSLTLHVKMGAKYPMERPGMLSLVEAKGISDQLVSEMQLKVSNLAKELEGDEMVMTVATSVADWMTAYNKPKFESFYEEMEARNKAETEKAQKAKEEERARCAQIESKERQGIREEVAKRAEELKEERLKWREEEKRRRQSLIPESPDSGDKDDGTQPIPRPRGQSFSRYKRTSSKSMSESSDFRDEPVTLEELEYKSRGETIKVTKGQLLGRNVLGGSVYLGIENGKAIAVKEWVFHTQRGKKKGGHLKKRSPSPASADEGIFEIAPLLRQITTIEQEMSSMQKVFHTNLVQYHGMSYHKTSNCVKLYVFEDFVMGKNMSFHLSENIPLELETLRLVITGLLEVLEHMHFQNFVHRDLRDTSVFLGSNAEVKIADFSIDKRIRDLLSELKEEVEEKFPVGLGRGGKKVDVYRLGLLTLSLAIGEISQDPVIPADLPDDLQDFLERCLDKNEHDRWTCSQLLDHKWIKVRTETSPSKFVKEKSPFAAAIREAEQMEDDVETAVPFSTVDAPTQSRLHIEFAFISRIGKGGFGEVMKVKNNLDGQVYAIKKIKLSSKNKQAMKKLIREVKLLSRLNHENVVRYYTSWVEVTTYTDNRRETETSFDEDSSVSSALHKSNSEKKRGFADDIRFQPVINSPMKTICEDSDADWEYSVSCSKVLPVDTLDDGDSDGEEEDDTDEEDDVFGTSFLPQGNYEADSEDEDDSHVVFEASRDADSSSPELSKANEASSVSEDNSVVFEASQSQVQDISLGSSRLPSATQIRREERMMYIQMEYCDKQTLRNAIDEGLHRDNQRLWRMFREIIEGLVHIHTQGMIHRDLKPVNVFIDSHDHIKIGDFGLATTNVIDEIGHEVREDTNESVDNVDSDMTAQIGTALYIAPEINAATGRVTSYTQKVDIYSLGVIFFEMCYQPLRTGMERIQVLNALRSKEVKLPADFDESIHMQKAHIIRWLLSHDASKRPNSQELLQSDYLPPPQVEEAELKEMIRHTLANSKSKSYRHVIDSCLGQSMDLAQDISYDMEICKNSDVKTLRRSLIKQEFVWSQVRKVFQRHGAIHIQMTHMLPKGKYKVYDKSNSLVQVMTRGGNVVSLPYDHRVPFARFLARSQLNDVKRYCIAPVFREVKIFGFHPRESVECAFDIVTPSEGSLLADSEILAISDELLNEIPGFRETRYFFRLNHTLLLRGILSNCGVSEELYMDVYNVIREGERWSKQQRISGMMAIGLSEQIASALCNALEHEGAPSRMSGNLRYMLKKKNAAASDIKQALSELETIIERAKLLGTKCEIVIAPSLVYNPGHFSGMTCQLVRKKRRGLEIMAAGGRYDHLINSFSSNMSLGADRDLNGTCKELNQCAVGISLSMDRLLAVYSSASEATVSSTSWSAIDVLIFSQSHLTSVINDKAELVSKLWAKGFKCVVCDIYKTVDEVQDYGQEFGASFIVILRDGDSMVRVRCLDKDRFQEKKVALTDVPEFLVRHSNVENAEQGASSGAAAGIFARSESVKTSNNNAEIKTSSLSVQVNYSYKFLDKSKYNVAVKKRLETAMSAKMTSSFSHFAPGTNVEVIAVPLSKAVIKSMISLLDFEDEASYIRSIQPLVEKHIRHRKELRNICDEIQTLKFEKSCSVFALYSADENFFSFLLAA